jgi:hypothetical protein
MRKALIGLVVLLAAMAMAATAGATTVTRATVASSIFDVPTNTLYPMTCDEQQVVNDNQRKETFHCVFDDAAPSPGVSDTSTDGAVWFSDFDGTEAISTHWVITKKGTLDGWALFS